ncbi:uncharacterized protein LOC115381683 isoform X2 [Salarias fasciatus]|uniref:uncharacterized protein LOC115381683 isoform X2 n=1 Tax=Salarias fasciatus TaxID=181472 RepID=UPI001176BA56|nr:uncharacterized protein LOC115381683 isoform X2 [Salarias fasciatus]
MRRMKVDRSHLLSLSREGTCGKFQKEGMLQVGREGTGLAPRFCRLRGNLLFILKSQSGETKEVLLLERCNVVKVPHSSRRLTVSFEGGDPPLVLQCGSSAECTAWLRALTDANVETLRGRIARLRTLIHVHGAGEGLEEERQRGGEFTGPVAIETGVKVQVSVDHTDRQVRTHPCSNDSAERNFLSFPSFSIRDLLKSKEPHNPVSLSVIITLAFVCNNQLLKTA